MAAAFAIFGAVGTSVALLNFAPQGFESLVKTHKDFITAGRNIADVQRRFENVCYYVQEWTKFWFFDLPINDELLVTYWGHDATRLIAIQLATVDRECEDLAAILRSFIPHARFDQIPDADREKIESRLQARGRETERRRLQKPSKFRDAFKRVTIRKAAGDWQNKEKEKAQVLEQHINNKTTTRKKAKFVLSSQDTIDTLLQELIRDYDELQKVSKIAWQSKHSETLCETSDWKQKRVVGLA